MNHNRLIDVLKTIRLPDNERYYFIGYQEYPGNSPVALYNLLVSTPNHPIHSTVAEETIKLEGI